jgi:hypothetical protein
MVKQLVPRDEKFAKFQYSLYRRTERWIRNKGIKCSEVKYAPFLKKGDDESFRPDVVFDIYRSPEELLLPNVIINSLGRPILMDGALQDWLDYYIQKKKDIAIRVILDATLWNFNNPKRWEDRVERTEKYIEESLKNDNIHFAVSAVVSPKGWNSSLDHAIEKEVHIISFNYLERFLDFILKVTDYEQMWDAIDDFIFMTVEECNNCHLTNWEYLTLYDCKEYGILTEDVIEECTDVYRDDGALIKEIRLCNNCSWMRICGGFDRFFSPVCKKCGNIKNGWHLHPCALVRLNGWYEECDDCFDLAGCEAYDRLITEGIIVK